MPINSGPGIGGRPGGSSFAPPAIKPAAAPTKWVITEAGGGGHSVNAARAPVTGSCIDILSDVWAWLCAAGASGAAAYLTQQAAAESSSTSKWIYIGASFGGYLCAIFVAGFCVAAFLWLGTKSRWAMRIGFTIVAAIVAAVPLAMSKLGVPSASQASAAVAPDAEVAPAEQPPAQEPVAQATPAVVEEPVVAPPPVVVEEQPRRVELPPQRTASRSTASRTSSRGTPTDNTRQAYSPRNAPRDSSDPDFKIVSAEVRTLLADVRTDALELQTKLQAEGMDSILAPTSFAGRARILHARRRLANIKRITDEYERTVMARFDEFPDRIYELNVSDGMKDAALRAFQARRDDGLKKLREIARLHRAILIEADRLFIFMDSRLGRYKVSDQILFQNAADAKTYTAHIERLQSLGARQERFIAENQKAALDKLASIERDLAGR